MSEFDQNISDFEDLFHLARHNQQGFGRDVRCEAYRVEGDKLLAIAHMHDDYHDMSLAIVVNRDFVIEAVAPKMTRVPYPICQGALDAYGNMVGLNIFQRGILRQIKDAVGRTTGCTHQFELVESSLRMLFAAMYSLRGVDLHDHLEREEVRQVNLHSKLLNGTCHSFANDSASKRIYDVALEKLEKAGINRDQVSPISR